MTREQRATIGGIWVGNHKMTARPEAPIQKFPKLLPVGYRIEDVVEDDNVILLPAPFEIQQEVTLIGADLLRGDFIYSLPQHTLRPIHGVNQNVGAFFGYRLRYVPSSTPEIKYALRLQLCDLVRDVINEMTIRIEIQKPIIALCICAPKQ